MGNKIIKQSDIMKFLNKVDEELGIPKKPPARMKGRPPKLDNDIIHLITSALLNLHTQQMAAHAAGLAEKSFYNYRSRGEQLIDALEENPDMELDYYEGMYVKFVLAIQAAETEVKRRHLHNIEKHSADKWQASAWLLERIWPDEFALRTNVKHTGSDGGPIKFTLNLGKPPELEEAETIDAEYHIE